MALVKVNEIAVKRVAESVVSELGVYVLEWWG
jgi:hypothetical protein